MKPQTTPKTVEVTIVDNWGTKTQKRQAVDCFYLKNNLAVTRGVCGDGYRVTHLPTGYYIHPTFTNKSLAKKFCLAISDLYDWNRIIDPVKAKRMYALKKKINLVRKRLKLEIAK